MSRISQDFINSVGYLYEEINIQQKDFLNEESQYYDAEATEIVEDILATISTMMVYEGHSVDAIIGFLANSSEETIIEKYLSFDEIILTESNVSEEYIKEQLELLENRLKAAASLGKAAIKTLFGKGLGYAPTKIQGPRVPGLLDKGKVLVSKGVQKVKDIAQGVKSSLTSPTAKNIAKLATVGGVSGVSGYLGARMGSSGSGAKSTESPKPSAKTPTPEAPKAPKVAAAPSTSSPKVSSAPAAKVKSKSQDKARPGETPMQQWARLHPNLAAKVKPGQSGYEEISQTRVKPGTYEKKDQTPTQGPSTAQVDKGDVEASIKQEQERQRKRLEQQKNTSMTAKESYEPYDVVLNYLMSEGHADTLDEANYIMLEMDEKAIGTIIEEYEDYLLAEEIQEWVNSLLDEGYDLSEYSWDDVVEYYVTEAKYGTVKGRKKLAKKVRAGKDVGKKGAGFEAIVDKASGKYGKERATKIAAAAMWKNLGK